MKIGIAEAAKFLGISTYKLHRLAADKHVPVIIIEVEKLVFDTDELAKIDIGSLPDYRGIVEANDSEQS